MPAPIDPRRRSSPEASPTGNMLVLMRQNMRTKTAVRKLEQLCGGKVAVSTDFSAKDAELGSAMANATEEILLLDNLKIAKICAKDRDASDAMSKAMRKDKDIKLIRPELHMFAMQSLEEKYRTWIRDGLRLLAEGEPDLAFPAPGGLPRNFADVPATWGVQAVGADRTALNGKGIKIAVLDTGLDLGHPDFAERDPIIVSFVPGEGVQDRNGHGTHTAGTAAGPTESDRIQRYGIAHEADLFIGKVLGNNGSGQESWILAGMEWAIENKCEVISMSLGRLTTQGEAPDPFYEEVGRVALENGSLIVAAAGNESMREFGIIAPVSAPANSRSIMAVGAVDSQMRIADFSCGGVNPNGGEVDIAAPGVDVFSAWPMPLGYRRLQGTSMACPHVAGVAALLAQSDPELRAQALWSALTARASDIGLLPRDAGAGLTQAPQDDVDQVPVA